MPSTLAIARVPRRCSRPMVSSARARRGHASRAPEAMADALFGFVGAHRSGQFETVHELFAGDEAYIEWKWAGVTTREGRPSHTAVTTTSFATARWQSRTHFERFDSPPNARRVATSVAQ